ncbi:MAG: NfeD family protein [Synergistaceae bacterium]|nr:NfeD family protein [Synergistaceae bacterium]
MAWGVLLRDGEVLYEIWNAISTGQEMRAGQFGRVKAVEGMRVIIE